MPVTALLSGRVASVLADFWRWWTTELRGIWHALPLRRTNQAAQSLIYLERDRVVVERIMEDQGERFVEDRPLASFDEQGFAELRSLTDGSSVALMLSAPDIYTARLSLPRAAAARLRSAIELQLSVVAPLKPELLAWVITDIRRSGEKLEISVTMAKRAKLNALRDLLSQNDCDDWRIGIAGMPGTVFGDEGSTAGTSLPFLHSKWLIGSVLAFASIPFTIILGAALLTAQAEARADALQENAKTNRLAMRNAALHEEQRQALMPLIATPGVATLLNELALTLPETDWLRSCERHADGSMAFIVVTRDPASLDTALRKMKSLPGLRVVDEEPTGEGLVDVSYETDGR